jgi:hypothetical protein
VLLNIFHLYLLEEPDEYRDWYGVYYGRRNRQLWWYRPAHVCRLWRNIILESPSRLNLRLFCTNAVPVADMLAHSPPLPITIDYHTHWEITAEDESGILLALSHRDRVRHIYFSLLPNMEKFITAMDDQFPILERMHIDSETVDLPVTFQAPNLRHLTLRTDTFSIGSLAPSLTTTASLSTLELSNIPEIPPSYILTRLSLFLQLEKLSIGFKSPVSNHDVEGQLHQTPDTITLPNLRWFVFYGVSAYLDVLVPWITAPSLSFLHVKLFHRLSFPFPRLLQFTQTSESFSFSSVKLDLMDHVVQVTAGPWRERFPLQLHILCGDLDSELQVASAVQIFGTLSPLLSAVERVTLSYERHDESSEWYNNIHRSQWRELLRPFINAKTICVQGAPVDKILRPLLSHDGEPPLELLPNLEEVRYFGPADDQDLITAFVDERQVAGHPVIPVTCTQWFQSPKYWWDLQEQT